MKMQIKLNLGAVIFLNSVCGQLAPKAVIARKLYKLMDTMEEYTGEVKEDITVKDIMELGKDDLDLDIPEKLFNFLQDTLKEVECPTPLRRYLDNLLEQFEIGDEDE